MLGGSLDAFACLLEQLRDGLLYELQGWSPPVFPPCFLKNGGSVLDGFVAEIEQNKFCPVDSSAFSHQRLHLKSRATAEVKNSRDPSATCRSGDLFQKLLLQVN